MKLKIFGFTITNEENKLALNGARAKTDTTKEKLISALQEIENKQLKYSEYKLQKISGVSINTIKKYREFIEEQRELVNRKLL